MSTLPQQKRADPVKESMFTPAISGRTALARKLTNPLPAPGPTKEERKQLELAKRRHRHAVHIRVVQNAAALAAATGAVGAVFLGGHVLLAREAQRSVIVNEMLNQQLELSRLLANQQARDITPTTVSDRAGKNGMVRPDERDAIVVR